MKRYLPVILAAIACSLNAQSPLTVNVTRIDGINTSLTVIDNRSTFSRSNTEHTFCATGTGTWSVTLQWSDTSSSGPWTNFADTAATVTNTSVGCFGGGYGFHQFLRFNISGTVSISYTGQQNVYIPTNFPTGGGGGSGTVTSANVTGINSFINTAGGPITASGAIALSLANQSANLGFFGPSSGSAAAPAFRAMVPGDVPQLTANQMPSFTGDVLSTAGTVNLLLSTLANLSTAWNSLASYLAGAIVSSGGQYYVAIAPNSNQQPPNVTYWALENIGPGIVCGDATHVAQITTDAKGRITSCTAVSNGGGTVTNTTSTLTSSNLLIGNSGADLKPLGALGTTAQVLIGNASGSPSFGQVNLATMVTGNLPVSALNGGTNASASTVWCGNATWCTPTGGGTVTNPAGNLATAALVSGSGGTTGIATPAYSPTLDTSGNLYLQNGSIFAPAGMQSGSGTTALLIQGLAGAPSTPPSGYAGYFNTSTGQFNVMSSAGSVIGSTVAAVNLAGTGIGGVTGNLSVTNLNGGTNASSVTFWSGNGTWATPAGGGSVTSVGAASTPGYFGFSGGPVTGSGTLTLTATSGQTANQFLATPNGSTGALALRGIAGADLPAINLAASGAGGVTGQLPTTSIASGDGTTTTKFLREDNTWQTPPGSGGGSGTVTNAANLGNLAFTVGSGGTVGIATPSYAPTLDSLGDITTFGTGAIIAGGGLQSGSGTTALLLQGTAGTPSNPPSSQYALFLNASNAALAEVNNGGTVIATTVVPGNCASLQVVAGYSSTGAATCESLLFPYGSTSISNPSSGALSITPDNVSVVSIISNTPGRVYTIPNPTNTSIIHGITITNIGAPGGGYYSFSLGGSNVQPGTSIMAVWQASGGYWMFNNPPTKAPSDYIVGLGCNGTATCIANLQQAVSDCMAGFNGCTIFDGNLTYNTGTTETVAGGPGWNVDGSGASLAVQLGEGILVTNGSMSVTHGGSVKGSGKSNTNGSIGTLIEPTTDGNFGSLIGITTTGGTGCSANDLFTVTSTHGTNSVMKATAVNGGGSPTAYAPRVLGGGYGADVSSFPAAGTCSSCTIAAGATNHCSAQPTIATATTTKTLMYVGDVTTSGDTFGAVLERLTLNCAYVNNCTALEVVNDQEGGWVDGVDAANYGGTLCQASTSTASGQVHGFYIHGAKSNNFLVKDVNVAGAYNSGSSIITGCTVPFEISNTYIGAVQKITVNPVNTTTVASATLGCSAGVITLTSGSWPAQYTYPGAVYLSAATNTGFNTTFPITAAPSGTTLLAHLYPGQACTDANRGASDTVNVAIVPAISTYVCGGTQCNDQTNFPTYANFSARHCEHSGDCLVVSGTKTSAVDINPTSTVGTTAGVQTHLWSASTTSCASSLSQCPSGGINSYAGIAMTANGNYTTNITLLDDTNGVTPPSQIVRFDSVVPFYLSGLSTSYGVVNPKSANYPAQASDCGDTIDATSTWSVTLPKIGATQSATFAAGCVITFDNTTGSGALTIVPNASNSLGPYAAGTSFVLPAGHALAIESDGANWKMNNDIPPLVVNLTGQTAALTAQAWTNTLTGDYLLSAYGETTTGSGTGSCTMSLIANYTDDIGSTTQTLFSGLAVASTGHIGSTPYLIHVASGTVTYSTVITGSGCGSYVYALRLVAERKQ